MRATSFDSRPPSSLLPFTCPEWTNSINRAMREAPYFGWRGIPIFSWVELPIHNVTKVTNGLRQFGLMGKGEAKERVTAVRVQLGADIRAVVLDRSDTHKQLLSNLGAGLGVGNELEHAPFSRSEITEGGLFG